MNINSLKLFLLCIMIPFTFTCQQSTKAKLKGTWIGAYYIEDSKNISNFNVSWEFKDDGIMMNDIAFSINDDTYFNKVSYEIKNDTLILIEHDGTFKMSIDILNEDSLVLNSTRKYEDGQRNLQMILKRANDIGELEIDFNKIKTNLINHAFATKSYATYDTIEFLNDTLSLHRIDNIIQIERWKLKAVSKYFYFSIESPFDNPPYFIKTIDNQKITANIYTTYTKGIDLIKYKYEPKNNLDLLKGKWVEDRKDRKREFPPPKEDKAVDKRLHLTITDSIIHFRKLLKTSNQKWITNSMQDFIIFPEYIDSNSHEDIWEIIKLTENELVVKVEAIELIDLPWYFDYGKEIRFHREQ